MAGLLSLERREDVAVVTLQRPEKRNALSIDLRVELTEAFGALGEDPGVGAVVLTGAPPAFCSGHGHHPVRRRPRAPASAWSRRSIGCFRAVGDCARPVVAAVNGAALAGGFALALLCDLRLAAESASFGFPGAAARDPSQLRGRARGAAATARRRAHADRPACSTPSRRCAWGSSAPSIPRTS